MIKINMGCGWRDFGEDWVHIDGGDYPHLDSKDIFNLPYDDNKVDLIYASHVIEYFNRNEVKDVLKEWIRVLKPNGKLRIAVPNFESIVKIYNMEGYSLDNCLGLLYGKMPMSNETIYHRTTYDYKSLSGLLSRLGIRDVKKWDWKKTSHSEFDDHSQAYFPHMDKDNGILMSLNVEGIK